MGHVQLRTDFVVRTSARRRDNTTVRSTVRISGERDVNATTPRQRHSIVPSNSAAASIGPFLMNCDLGRFISATMDFYRFRRTISNVSS